MAFNAEGYYTLREILGYNANRNFVLSQRGIGKSYDSKRFLMAQPGESMMLYRQEPDMKFGKKGFLGDLKKQGWELDRFRWETEKGLGATLYLDDRPKIWFRYLTAVNHIKNETFPDTMDWVIFDEFIPLKYTKLPGIDSEGDAFESILTTIDHDTFHSRESRGLRPLRAILFGNPGTWNNPILSYYGIHPQNEGIRRIGPGVVCEFIPYEEPKEGGRATVHRTIGNRADACLGWHDETAFIREPGRGAHPRYSIRLYDRYFMIYVLKDQYWVKATRSHPSEGSQIMRFGTFDRLTPGEQCIEVNPLFAVIKNLAFNGRFYYDSLNTKFEFINGITDER